MTDRELLAAASAIALGGLVMMCIGIISYRMARKVEDDMERIYAAINGEQPRRPKSRKPYGRPAPARSLKPKLPSDETLAQIEREYHEAQQRERGRPSIGFRR